MEKNEFEITQQILSNGRIKIDSKHGENKDISLHKAALQGNFKICELLLRHGATVNSSNASNTTPLHLAIAGGNVDVFMLLLDSGADLNRRNNYGLTSLHIAAGCGHLQLCRILLKDYSLDLYAKDNGGKIPLHVCAHSHSWESFQFLVEMGSDVHLKTKTGGTCLHIAAEVGDLNLCKMLLKNPSFDVHMIDDQGGSPLHFCAVSGNNELFKFLVEMGGDIYLKTKSGKNCLHIAAEKGQLNLCQWLLQNYKYDVNITDNDGWTPLHSCLESGNNDLFQFFINIGSKIYLNTNTGQNCLHIAAASGNLILCKTLLENYVFDIHATDIYGYTALHWCAKGGNYELFHFFMEIGSDVHRKTIHGTTCLNIAAKNGHWKFYKLLLEEYEFDLNEGE